MLAYEITQIVYWLALSTWFGGILFVAVATPVIFRTLRESNLSLPDIHGVNLEGHHPALLAGSVVANLLALIARIELLCAGLVLITIISQYFVAEHANIAPRAAIYVLAVAVFLYDWKVVWPQIRLHRQTYIDHADESELADPARAKFDHFHAVSVNLLSLLLVLLVGMVLFSGGISPMHRFIEITAP